MEEDEELEAEDKKKRETNTNSREKEENEKMRQRPRTQHDTQPSATREPKWLPTGSQASRKTLLAYSPRPFLYSFSCEVFGLASSGLRTPGRPYSFGMASDVIYYYFLFNQRISSQDSFAFILMSVYTELGLT